MDLGFDTIFSLTLEPGQLIANLVVALLCGLIVSFSYRFTSESLNYSPNFVRSLVVLSMITALVIMVIGNNLARAFGLVGAMSIIRFRTAVKDVQDILYIFFALAVGMAAGVGLKAMAFAGTVLIVAILILLQKVRYAHPTKNQFIIQFRCDIPAGDPPYQEVFNEWTKKTRLSNMRSLGPENLFELTFYVELKEKEKRNEFIRSLNSLSAVGDVRVFFDDV